MSERKNTYVDKSEDCDTMFYRIAEQICLVHLVAMQELPYKATLKDSENFFNSVGDCSDCPYNQNCLACMYTEVTMG